MASTEARRNPFLEPSALPYQAPPFDRISDADFAPAFEAGMRQQLAEMERIAANAEAPGFDNTIVAMERSGEILSRVSSVFFSLVSAHSNPAIQEVQKQMAPRLSAHRDAIYLNPALYARVSGLYEQRAQLGLDAEALRLLERYHTDFVRAGARLSAADQAKLRLINEELSSLRTRFGQNLLKDTNESAVVVDSVTELDGLAPGAVAAAAEAARTRQLVDRYVLSLQLPTLQPALSDLKHRALRERIYMASINRGNNDNEYDNKQVAARIAWLRAQSAALLGYPSYAAFSLETQTARTPEAVNRMLAGLAPAAVANAKVEADDMQALIDRQARDGKTRPFKLAPWDWSFYAEQVRRERFDYDEAEVKPYFEMERVLQDGVFYFAHELYGLSFVERHDLPVYHPDVRVFEVFDADGSALGLFYADYFSRPSKRGGAWMNAFVEQSDLLGRKAVVTNTLNIPKPSAGQPVLLTFDEVSTMFHEFGHALHGLFSKVRYPLFSGTSVPRDFVEYPSQVHEMWALWPQVLAHYARHYQTDAPIPQGLVDKILKAQKFNQGFSTTEYLAASLLDQAWHQLPASVPEQSALPFEQAALQKAGVALTTVAPRYRTTYFNHVFSGGYAAGYYAYIWAEVLDADTVRWFEDHGGLKRENGDWFHARLLSRGGSADAMELFRNFRGRDPAIEPLLERRGLSLAH
jgi:peptidyl-dipeptidase Dcp